MLLPLLVIVLFQPYSASMPMLTIHSTMEGPAQPTPSMKTRTVVDIIWNCSATLFICTWVAIHPNIPPLGQGSIMSVWRRLKLMFWTLLVPELILIWAYRQWNAARYIAEYFQEEGWTPTHGYFLMMGGFTIVTADGERVLDFDKFCELLGLPDPRYDPEADEFEWDEYLPPESLNVSPRLAFPRITAAEIHDKARGDFLSKAIAILQTLWFIARCITRAKQGLALTELELVTLALASLNAAMYYFWWDKPLGVNEPVRLHPIDEEPPKKIIRGALIESRRRLLRHLHSSNRSLLQRLVVIPFHKLRSLRFQPFKKSATTSLSFRPGCLHLSLSTINKFLDESRRQLHFPGADYLWFIYLPFLWFFIHPILALAVALFDIASNEHVDPNANHVPTFYTSRLRSSTNDSSLFFLGLPIIAVIFGALHVIAWNFEFPSHVEQSIWRCGSLAITIIPAVPIVVILLLSPFIGAFILLDFLRRRYNIRIPLLPRKIFDIVGGTLIAVGLFLVGAGLIAYMFARLVLLVLAVVLLRKQPESAFYEVDWGKFLSQI